MPARAHRPCRHPGCPALVRVRHGLCPDHLKSARKRADEQRDSSAERGYGAAWRRARAAFLRLHPVCECDECRAQHRLLPASVVDHRVPHRGDMRVFWDQSNWQALAKRCHDRKTATHDGGFGNALR
ncbi:HNH endonuclease [Paraburkholderia panacisoli]|uniref:HNH endonuclease n=1 Tax=Paraburkholderia panacisoli TaxID=2603818 RepID=A0A5B0HL31_9BURK|nr:HNH endonuclease [Paraburkholderia panacisoli]KAA1015961.1 HNH endonuclease [Paraburkholderia panacisoli]